MKTHGFEQLRIVGKEIEYLETQARKTAYGSHDILEGITFYSNLKEALKDVDFAIGTSAKNRTLRKEPVLPPELISQLNSKISITENAAIVFGSEENGLSTEDLALCDILSTIPLETEYPSLNLSQSVLVYLYEFNRFSGDSKSTPESDPMLYRKLKEEAIQLLEKLDFGSNPSYFQRLKDRLAMVEPIDAHLIMAVIKKLKNYKP